MKRLYIGIFSLLLAIQIALFGFLRFQKMYHKLGIESQALEVAIQNKNKEEIYQHVEKEVEIYQKNRKLLGILVNENELKELDLFFLKLKSGKQNIKELKKTEEDFILALQEVYDSEKINIQNIL